MTAAAPAKPDALTAASVTIAWTILGNKPFYPLYVWWLIDKDAAIVSLWTLVGTPLYAAVPYLAKRNGRAARIMLVVAGIVDTIFASVVLGYATGAAYFLFPCLMLAALCFRVSEVWFVRAAAAVAFIGFAALTKFGGADLHAWTPEQAKTLDGLNLYCAIALSAFIVLRFSTVARDGAAPLDA